MTKEQRVELLKLAREAKAKKKQEREALKPKPIMGRPRKKIDETFEPPDEEPKQDINDEQIEDIKMEVNDDEIDEILNKPKIKNKIKPKSLNLKLKEPEKEPKKDDDEEEEVQEEIIYKKRPKKKILRKIIYEESTDDEIEEVVIDNRKNKPIEKEAKVKKVSKPVPLNAPKEPEVKPGFNFFKY